MFMTVRVRPTKDKLFSYLDAECSLYSESGLHNFDPDANWECVLRFLEAAK